MSSSSSISGSSQPSIVEQIKLIKDLKRKYPEMSLTRFQYQRQNVTKLFEQLEHNVDTLIIKQDRLINQLFHIIESSGQSLSELDEEDDEEEEESGEGSEDDDDGNEGLENEGDGDATVVAAFPEHASTTTTSSSSSSL